jgi:hypothetical protein
MNKKNSVFRKSSIRSAIIFFSVLLLYTLVIDVNIELKNVLIILLFTIVFWLLNSTQTIKDSKK